MTGWRLVVLAAVAVLLQACGPTFKTVYEYTAPRTSEGRQCASQCQSVQGYCRSTCKAENNACKYQSRLEAQLEYERYVARQTAAGKKIERSVSSFERWGACNVDACDKACESDFRLCYSTCGGTVTERTICTSGCEEVGGVGSPRMSQPLITPANLDPDEDEEEDSRNGNASLCRKGAQIEVFSGDWYKAKVKGPLTAEGRCPVHYIGYDDDEDEDVLLRNMRGTTNGNASLCRKGAQVEVYSGEWYTAKVKGPLTAKGRCPVHYIGYDDDEDEDVLPKNMRRISK